MDGSWAWSGSQSQIVGAFATFCFVTSTYIHFMTQELTSFTADYHVIWMHHSLSTEEPSWFQILAIMSEAFVDLHEGFNVNSFRFFRVNRKDFILCVWFPEKQLGHLLQWLFSLHSHLDSSAAPYPCHLLVVLVVWILTVLVHIYCFSL